jgi:SpoVK/Ycf46/Vps4 family AAA+-type ATPase
MENNRDRIVVVVAGYQDKMRHFIDSNPGLSRRFTRRIEFPPYSENELIEIFARLARNEGRVLPAGFDTKLRSWLGSAMRAEGWGNAGAMRAFLEHVRDEQALRISGVAKADLSKVTLEDIERAIRAMEGGEAGDDTPPPSAERALQELDQMVGLASVKQEVKGLFDLMSVERRRREQGLPVTPMSLHMVFTGPPGVGKTEVARKLGAIYAAAGKLRRGHVVAVERADLIGQYVGQTAPKTLDRCKDALDGILFIDEAYSLATDQQQDFGNEAIATILTFMENNRDRIIVIVAGYPAEMARFIDRNPGLSSRFTRRIQFPAYDEFELAEIFARMAKQQGLVLASGSGTKLRPWLARAMHRESWGNARDMRNLLERVRVVQAGRIAHDPDADLREVTIEDIGYAVEAMEQPV